MSNVSVGISKAKQRGESKSFVKSHKQQGPSQFVKTIFPHCDYLSNRSQIGLLIRNQNQSSKIGIAYFIYSKFYEHDRYILAYMPLNTEIFSCLSIIWPQAFHGCSKIDLFFAHDFPPRILLVMVRFTIDTSTMLWKVYGRSFN